MKQVELEILVKELSKLPNETEWVEFKHNNFNPDEIGRDISALSNGAALHEKERAYIIFGIDDKTHNIIGTTFKPRMTKKGNEELESWLSYKLEPRINFFIFEFEYQTKPVVIFEICATFDRPVTFDNKAYIRVGSYTKPLKSYPEKERRIWNNPLHRSFEREVAMLRTTADNVLVLLDYPSYFELTKQPLPNSRDVILEKLEQDKLIEKEQGGLYSIKNLGALLFAKNLQEFDTLRNNSVRVIEYAGDDRTQTIREQEGHMGYAPAFQKLIVYINSKLPSNEMIQDALRVEKKMYPEIAIRELLANALIHQDFLEHGNGPMIEVFKNRLEITNKGIPLISTDRFIDSAPQARNEKTASFMRRIGICEQRGSGIDKVINSIEVYQLPAPDFIVADKSTKAILYAPRKLTKMSKKDKIRACYQHCCIKYVASNFMDNSSLRKRFNIKDSNYPAASKIIKDTIETSLIKLLDTGPRHSRKFAKYVPFWA
ncbi:putative DNA binding domain-containing protein [Patescibacteria group bacterium]|nr:putative DNA binding domain-containing protein [Patescibacteria group bacterium]